MNYEEAQLYYLNKKKELESIVAYIETKKEELEDLTVQQRRYIEEIAKQKSKGFPWLADAYAEYFYMGDLQFSSYLRYKNHPAKKSV